VQLAPGSNAVTDTSPLSLVNKGVSHVGGSLSNPRPPHWRAFG